jgi:deoxyuridine 5'-triphosphate nucleotidohydrolase
MPVNIKVINRSSNPLPGYATEHSSGMDIRANLDEPVMIHSFERILVPTGLFVEIPDGYEAQIRPRSGLAIKQGITCLNSPGTIDADYRGEIKIILINLSSEVHVINPGERIAQMVIQKVEKAILDEVSEIKETERNAGGLYRQTLTMKRIFVISAITVLVFASCKPTKKIQTAIIRKDTVSLATDNKHADSLRLIHEVYNSIRTHHIDFTTFSARVDVDYIDADNKKYDVNANLRMYKDSAIWVSINAVFGIEGLRALITKDSVKILDKQDKVYTARSIKFLQEVSGVPFDLPSLQDLLIGNAVFLDSNIVSYTRSGNTISLLSIGPIFKNLVTIAEDSRLIQRMKLDDVDDLRNRTGDVTYSDYENKKGFDFAITRKIVFAEKKKLDIRLKFKQYNFNEPLNFPFTVPKNYTRN